MHEIGNPVHAGWRMGRAEQLLTSLAQDQPMVLMTVHHDDHHQIQRDLNQTLSQYLI